MEFLVWHYTEGIKTYLNNWISYLDWINHYFSPLLLIRTLFSPWKRLVIVDKRPGFDIGRFFETLTFNIISRTIGAIVRFTLLWVGIILIIISFFGGLLGIIIWLFVPIVGFPHYSRYNRRPERFIQRLMEKLAASPEDFLKIIFENEAGEFVLLHTQLELDDLVKNARTIELDFIKLSPKSYEEIIRYLIKRKLWTKEFLRKRGVKGDDLILAAYWWDRKKIQETQIQAIGFGRPGIGLELLFGYTPTLNQYSVDLSIPLSYSHRLIGREQVVSRMERVLTAGSSVVLVGAPGVGKKTVVLEFAHRATQGQLGPKMSYRRILEFDHNFLLSEATDLNLKKAKLSQVLEEASAAGNIILMFRDIQRLTNPDVEGYDFTDVFEEYLERRELKIIAVSTPGDYERFIAPNMRLRKFLETVEVMPPTKEEAMEILIEAAQRWEGLRGMIITIPALRKILDESDRYITEVPFPEKVLELLDALVMYKEQKGGEAIAVEDAEAILAEKTGISFARLTEQEKKLLGKLEEIIHERLINQDTAVELIAKALRAKTVGVAEEKRPLGSFLFLGPTGVGKTETAKVLARVYYGSEENMLRFDMAEYAGEEGLERLIGSVSKNQPGLLTTSIKNRPASLLLLDEIEKATPEIYNLFLTLLDEGEMTDAFGKKINCRHLFVIGTSNAGAEYIRQLVSKGTTPDNLQKLVVEHVLQKGIFTPEFLNRFDGVVVYEPLKKEDLIKIARLLLNELAVNLKKKGIYLQVTQNTAEKLAVDGYVPEFGARPMRRIINLILGDLIGRAILAGDIKEGDKIRIIPGEKKEEYGWQKV